MSWASAVKNRIAQMVAPRQQFSRPAFPVETIDWPRLVSLDFETAYDADFTLSKQSTSEYIRDPRFEALMVGLKVGLGKTRVIPSNKISAELKKIPWATHSLLCHNMQFDGFIVSHHHGIHPKRLYCSLSMARGLHSNDIGAGLDEVSIFYGGHGKIEGGVEGMKGIRFKELFKNKPLWNQSAAYCANDVDEMLRIFKCMLPFMPKDEMDLIHLTNRMFCDPVLKVDIPRVQVELKRELDERRDTLLSLVDEAAYADEIKLILKTKAERELTGEDRQMLFAKRVIGSNERFASLLRDMGVEPPLKLSPAWMKKPASERTDEGKWAYAFAKDDAEFINLPDQIEEIATGLNLENPSDVQALATRQTHLRTLVNARLMVKSTTNITRAERFLTAGANGMSLPVGYAYYRAVTGRFGGNNKMNLQNLTRGGELRLSILAPAGHVLVVADSGQIEARVNGWLWGQDDLLQAFSDADRGVGVDAYCRMATAIYGRPITKADKTERFVGKVIVLGMGYQMGAPKLQITLAKGALGGPPVYFELERCQMITHTYRRMNHRIRDGWAVCKGIIEDMAAGIEGSHGPLSWEHETIWLPNGMCLKYPDLKKRQGDKGWDEWTYQSKDMRKKIYGGLLCLGAATEVLTDAGWKPLIEVRSNDKVWDGLNWVIHSGLTYRGRKTTINFGGVQMTPDHEVLVDGHWTEAQDTTHHEATSSFARHHRTPHGHVDRHDSTRGRRGTNVLARHLRLRGKADHGGFGFPERGNEELRMSDPQTFVRSVNHARHVETPGLLRLAQHARSLQTAYASVLGSLRRARNNCVRGLERIRDILGGHVRNLSERTGLGPQRQFAGLQRCELPMDYSTGERPQHTCTSADRHTPRADAALASRRGLGDQQHHTVLPQGCGVASIGHVQKAGLYEQEVFDLVDAGPLRRFTVRGSDGEPFIVHNCENIVQALARIIVMWQMLQVDKKYRIVMTTHDEAVACVKKAQAETAMRHMSAAFKTPLPWCLDLPLNSEGGYATNYSK